MIGDFSFGIIITVSSRMLHVRFNAQNVFCLFKIDILKGQSLWEFHYIDQMQVIIGIDA